jgi:uncharacterized membrane protein
MVWKTLRGKLEAMHFKVESTYERNGVKEYFCILLMIIFLTDFVILLNIPFLRQIMGFLFLTILPGLLILQILKLDKIRIIETILYSLGLSIAFLMFSGLFINTFYPLLGVSKPLSPLPLIITTNISIVVLCIWGYKTNKGFLSSISVNIKEILSPPALLLYLLPFLAIFGTYLVRFHHNNTLLMLMIVIIALIVILVAFDKFIPKKLYPLAIFMISITLLYHRSLISPYLFGSDIQYEYYVYKFVELNSHWDPGAVIITCNAMLSITVLPAIYSSLLNMDGTWLFKIVYPLLFSFVPLGLYHIYQKQTDEKIAFLSTFFFVSFYGFFVTMLYLMRQEIAVLFLVLLILLMIDKEMKPINRSMLAIIFATSLIVSHYATSYIYMLTFLPVFWLSPFLMNSTKKTNIGGTFVALYFIIAISWYMYLVNSITFNSAIGILENILFNITAFFSPLESESLVSANFVGEMATVWHLIAKFFVNVTQLFIIVGVVLAILKRKEMNFDKNYFSAVIVSLSLIFACVAIPYVASSLNMDRIYVILLLFLSPFCILGGVTICNMSSKLFRRTSLNKSISVKIVTLAVLIPYFLFNTGFVYEAVGDIPTAIPLSLEGMKNSDDIDAKMQSYTSYIREQDIYSIAWMSHVSNTEEMIYCDEFASYPLIGYGMVPWEKNIYKLSNATAIRKDAYVYLGSLNVVEGIARNWDGIFNITEVSPLLEEKNKIYSNGGSEIYK